tara:strand:- start:4339 stop:4740 length:402 start_codon:yes stop_codon:yes gene_type:complete
MEKTIQIAKITLADTFSVPVEIFEKTYKGRQKNVVEARRFLVYFLRKELDITYEKICEYCPTYISHATVMHHYKKLDDFMKYEKHLKAKYDNFKSAMLTTGFDKLEKELNRQIDIRNSIDNNIKTLKNLIDES